MAVLPGVLGCRPLRRTTQVRLGANTLWLPGGTPIFAVSRQGLKLPAGRLRRTGNLRNVRCLDHFVVVRSLTQVRSCRLGIALARAFS
ncbi:MAG: hypothetical protein LJE87_10415 [Deltaproteobacteria bacterium]|nr:hypothetical protein [Deltaproteobacteria bacterium]